MVGELLKECITNKIINMNELKKVPDSDFENKIIYQILTQMTSCDDLLSYNTKKWELFDNTNMIPNNFIILGNFDIRDRIVDPPIAGFTYIKYEAKNKKKVLAYKNL